jgi:quercetin dioxygenase-like cupin family protein
MIIAKKICTGALALAAAVSLPALSTTGHHTAIAVDSVRWKPGPSTLPPGAQFAILVGSPTTEGPFVLRLKLPAGYTIPPHRHSKEEHVTVISGGFGMSTGKKVDRTGASLVKAGGLIRIPANTAHYAWTEEETVVQINGVGPFDVFYVEPGDDPRKKH